MDAEQIALITSFTGCSDEQASQFLEVVFAKISIVYHKNLKIRVIYLFR